MERRFPWHWTEGRAEQLVAGVCIFCAAFAAPSFVATVLDSHMYRGERHGLPLVISTAIWAWAFRRFLWKRNLWHFAWAGPLFGALNAGTTLGLSTLVSGQGVGEAMGGVLMGSFFGTFLGGGPLGIIFGGVLTLYIGFARKRLADRDAETSLQLLRASAFVFALAGVSCTALQLAPGASQAWPTNVLLIIGGLVTLVAAVAHLHALIWARKVRTGAKRGTRVHRDEFDVELVILEERGSEEGAFRTPEREKILGRLPRRLGLGAAQSVGSILVIALAWAVLN
ncbi:MAG: hypothetical protein ACI9KE_006718 [Polyangiales bacterium]|jgi:hypothetical protein